jgi:hypothetical protein
MPGSGCRESLFNNTFAWMVGTCGVSHMAGFVFRFESVIGNMISCTRMNLRKGRGSIKWILGTMWRYRLIPGRYFAMSKWCRGEGLRSVATRRHTFGTGEFSGSAYLEKSGCFIVKNGNKRRVFQCTVNWSRARHVLAFISVGSAESRRVYSGRVR